MSIPLTAVLDFEAKHPAPTGRKAALIRPTFGLSEARYYQRLNFIISTGVLLAQALEHDPATTARLVRLQEERTAKRNARKVTPS